MKFHKRFELPLDREEAEKRFVNRAYNRIFYDLHARGDWDSDEARRLVVSEAGERFEYSRALSSYFSHDFIKTLEGIEAFYRAIPPLQLDVDLIVESLLDSSELDLEIRWEQGRFYPTGAQMLDDALINGPLRWLRERGHTDVLEPFEKGLRHYLHSAKRPELLVDVITEMYESLEALAQVITGKRAKDLSANRELFVRTVRASDAYKALMRSYIEYANLFRHPAGGDRPCPSRKEVESFMYMTGVFLRLAMPDGSASGSAHATSS